MHGERRFSASSKTAWMLLSVVAAFALLAWSAQQDSQHAPRAAGTSFLYGVDQIVTPAGRGFFGRIGDAGLVSGVDTVTDDRAPSVHMTKRAHEAGVDGTLAVPPYYNKPPQRAIVRHFEEIAAVTDKPVVVYNIPSRVVVNIEPETIAELAKIPNVRAVKQAHDVLDEARVIPGLGLDLYAGDDNLIFPFLGLGAVGGICVHTHVWGRQTKDMVRLYRSGDVEGARALNEAIAPAFDLLKIATNPIPIKAAMNLLGHELGGYRLPMVDPTDDELDQVRACLERAGMLATAAR